MDSNQEWEERVNWPLSLTQAAARLLQTLDAILSYLEDTFDCRVDCGSPTDLGRWSNRSQFIARVVVVQTDEEQCGRLTIIYTKSGGFVLRLGLFYDQLYAIYGTYDRQSFVQERTQMWRDVCDLVEGRFVEVEERHRLSYEFVGRMTGERPRASLGESLDPITHRWAPWPLRATSGT